MDVRCWKGLGIRYLFIVLATFIFFLFSIIFVSLCIYILDIVSLNIQRGRDHQIQGYPFYKNQCKLGNTEKWSDLEDLIPKETVHELQHAYKNPGDIDFYVGGTLGKTFY